MKLNISERLTILQILPIEGNFVTLNIILNLRKALAPTEEDYKKYDLVQKGDKVSWNDKGNEEVEIEIGEKATDIIVESLEKLDKDKKLTNQHFSVYKKFIKGGD